ncbi:MAG: DUF3566 domain-containing protein [Nitriliruptoraceae bacterium]|nr:DUF3566 domain-containing protein [Nitriliruptoraceae bacterium]
MARRRLTIKRLDPWSVLKFSILAHLVGFAVLMLVAGVFYYVIDQLQLIDQACGIAADVGFTSCGINTTNLFRALALLGGMGVVVATAVSVFVAFLYNLIADLTGGITVGVVDDAPAARGPVGGNARPDHSGSVPMDRAVTTGRRPAVTGSTTVMDGDRSGEQPRTAPASDEVTRTQQQEPVGRGRRHDGDELFRED